MKNIQMVDLKSQHQKLEKEINLAIKKVIDESAFINGAIVKEFTNNLSSHLKVKHVIPCGNGTDALQIALMSLDLQPGDEVITSTFTFIATAEVIALLKLKPVFVDVDERNFNILPSEIENNITEKTKVILPVHLFGQSAPMEEILDISKKHNLFVIEDNAQALGSQYTFKNGSMKFTGTMGDIGTTSFFPSKNLGCYGDGGAIFTDNDELAEKIRMICNHGSKVKYNHTILGVNSRLDSIQAAILNVKLKKLDEFNTSRRRAASIYSKALQNLDWIRTPKKENYSTHVFHQYTLQIENGRRDDLKACLEQIGIPNMIYYPIPLHKQMVFKEDKARRLINAENLSSKVLSLPIHTELTTETINFIVEKINLFK